MEAKPPLAPLAREKVLRVTVLAVATSLLLKVAEPVAVTVSEPTKPPVMLMVGVAVVVPS